MSIKCVAKECISSSISSDIFFYKFPTDKDSSNKWLDILNRADLKGTSLHNHFVCSLHFQPQNLFTNKYDLNDFSPIYGTGRSETTCLNMRKLIDKEPEYIDVENDMLELEYGDAKHDYLSIKNLVGGDYSNVDHIYNTDGDEDQAEDMIRILEKEGDRIVCIDGIGYVRLFFEPPDYLSDIDEELFEEDADEDKDEIYQCAHCEAQFEDFNFLKIHVHQHSLVDNKNISPFGKSRILKEFKDAFSINKLKNNNMIRNIYGSLNNPILSKTSNNVNLFNKCNKEHQCNDCGKNFVNLNGLRNHSGLARPGCRPFICPICDRRFALLSCLKNHIQSIHSDCRYQCKLCGKSYMNEHYLKVHLRLHGSSKKTYQCIICHKTFVDQPALKLHMRTHTGERPFKCHVCGRAFTQQSHLKTHIRLHTGERPFNCDLCEKSFRQISNLIEHRRRHERNARLRA